MWCRGGGEWLKVCLVVRRRLAVTAEADVEIEIVIMLNGKDVEVKITWV